MPSKEIAEVLRIVDDSGLPYQLTPAGTCIEGDWDGEIHLLLMYRRAAS